MATAFTIIPDRFADGRHDAFDEGARAAGFDVVNARGMQAIPGKPGDVLITWNMHGYKESMCRQFEEQGGRVVVCEEGYTRKVWPVKHFAISLHGHNGSGEWRPGNASRWRAMGLEPKDWRVEGEHILVCGQRGIGNSLMASPKNWHEDVAKRLMSHTRRPLLVRPHPGPNKATAPPLADQMRNAWAVVVWSSACAIQALLEGIPVIVEAPHHILDGAVQRGIERADRPAFTNRADAFERMAWAQWTMDEIKAGAPFRHLLA